MTITFEEINRLYEEASIHDEAGYSIVDIDKHLQHLHNVRFIKAYDWFDGPLSGICEYKNKIHAFHVISYRMAQPRHINQYGCITEETIYGILELPQSYIDKEIEMLNICLDYYDHNHTNMSIAKQWHVSSNEEIKTKNKKHQDVLRIYAWNKTQAIEKYTESSHCNLIGYSLKLSY